MKTAHVVVISGVVAIAIGTVLVLNRFRSPSHSAVDRAEEDPPPKIRLPRPIVPDQNSPPIAVAASTRAAEMQRLKRRWLAGPRIDHVIRPEHKALARETVGSLLCSSELVALMQFLQKQEGMGGADVAIDGEMKELLRSERAGNARQSLITLSGTGYVSHYREQWSFYAGRGCPTDQFDSFCAALADQNCVYSASFGRNLERVKIDPTAAVLSTVELLRLGYRSMFFGSILNQLTSELPADSPFDAIERSLPLVEDDGAGVGAARHNLVRKWATRDPAAAASYIMANPERISPDKMMSVAEQAVRNDPITGVEWVQSLPKGPYLDNAVRGAIAQLYDDFPKEGRELASLISDSEIRKEVTRSMDGRDTRRTR